MKLKDWFGLLSFPVTKLISCKKKKCCKYSVVWHWKSIQSVSK